MKTIRHIFIFLVFTVFWSCKERQKIPQPNIEEKSSQSSVSERLPPLLTELLKFADTTLADGTDIDQILVFKKIDTDGKITIIDAKEGVRLYNMTTLNRGDSSPIFEIKNTDTAILPVSGKGFGGPIWAMVLVDRTAMAIKKIEFGHKAESEGYGAAFTQNTFENQFVGVKLNLDENFLILKKNMEKRIDDGVVIDGISGATMTSDGAIEMVNLGLRKYRGYLNPSK